MKLSDFLEDVGRSVAYYPRIAKAVGGVKEAVFLCQLFYWKDKGEGADGWIYKTQAEIEDETGLSRYEQEHARKSLVKRGLIEEKYQRITHKMFYRVMPDALNLVWEQRDKPAIPKAQKSRSRKQQSNIPECSKPTLPNAEKPHSANATKQHSSIDIDDHQSTTQDDVQRETRAHPPQNSTSTRGLERPPETRRTAAPLVDMSNPNDPRFTTPFYPAVALACGYRAAPLEVSFIARGKIASVAAKFEHHGYTVEQIATMAENWTMPNPPSPDQLFDRADSLLRTREKTNGNHNPQRRDTNRFETADRRFEEQQDMRRRLVESIEQDMARGLIPTR